MTLELNTWVSTYRNLPAELARKRAELEHERSILIETVTVGELDTTLARLARVCAKLDALQILENEVNQDG